MRRRKEAKTRNDLTKLVYAYIYIMHREQSLSKLSSRSLSKIKTKIDLAFSRPVNNENRSKNGQNLMPSRSKSTKSLGKSKCEPSDNTIPFAIAIKSGLVQTDRKSSALQTPIKRPVNSLKGSETRKEQVLSIKNQVFCEKMLLNEYIKGFSWYHSAGKELISVCKKSQDNTTLRYFAVKQFQDGKNNKKVVAALEGTFFSIKRTLSTWAAKTILSSNRTTQALSARKRHPRRSSKVATLPQSVVPLH